MSRPAAGGRKHLSRIGNEGHEPQVTGAQSLRCLLEIRPVRAVDAAEALPYKIANRRRGGTLQGS